MRNSVVRFLLFFVAFSLLACFVVPLTPVSASEPETYLYNGLPLPPLPSGLSYSIIAFHPYLNILLFDFTSVPTPTIIDGVGKLSFDTPGTCSVYQITSGSWVISNTYDYDSLLDLSYFSSCVYYWSSFDVYNSADHLFFPGSDPVVPGFNSGSSEPSVPVHGDGIYYQAYDLLSAYVYGIDSSDLSSDQQLTLTAVSTVCCLFLVSLPFLLVWFVIKIFR